MRTWKYSTPTAVGFTDYFGTDFWFSYKTLVAFRVVGGPLVVRENDWGPTSGKHLNAIDGGDKKDRVPAGKFQELLCKAMADLTA